MKDQENLAPRYHLNRLLGKGGMGQVYEAWDQILKKKVALKFLSASLAADAQESFREEARLLTHLSHPNLISILDYHSDGGGLLQGAPFFSMEYLEEESLEKDPRSFSASEWISILAQIAQALHYLHRRHLLHGDIKPSNIVVQADGGVKILDFGLAPLRSQRRTGQPAMGSPAYLPPEIFSGAPYDTSTDLYSLGILLFEKMAGRLPDAAARESEPGASHLHRLRPNLPTFLCDLIHRLLARDPAQRPRSALSLIRFLNQHLESPLPLQNDEDLEVVLRKPPFVARKKERSLLEAAFAEPEKSGSSRICSVEGPTGVGRSRLLEEFFWQIRLQGIPCSQWGPRSADEALRHPSEGKRAAVFACTDLQDWSIETRRELLGHLDLILRAQPGTLILLEFNSEKISGEFFNWLETLLEGFPVERFRLAELDLQDTRELLNQAAAGFNLSAEQADQIASASGGRPLLALEILRQHLQSEEGERTTRPFILAANWKEAIQNRLSSLERRPKELLALMAVEWEVARKDVLRVSGWEEKNFSEAWDALEAKAWISPLPDGKSRWTLQTPSLAGLVVEALPEEDVRTARREWIQFYRAQFPEAKAAPQTLRLFDHAWFLQDIPSVKKYGMAAAEQSQKQLEDRRSAEIYEKLLTVADTPEERFVLNAHLAPVYSRLARYEQALAAYDRWFAERPDDESFLQKLKHRFYTGLVYFQWKQTVKAKLRLQEAVTIGNGQAYPTHRPYLVRAYNLLAALAERSGEESEVQTHLESARRWVEGNDFSLGEIEHRLGNWNFRRLDWVEAAAAYQRARQAYARADNPQAEAISLSAAAMLLLAQGRLKEARAAMEQALDKARAAGETLQTARYQENLALIFLEAGEYAQTASLFESSERLLTALGQKGDRIRIKLHRARWHLALGRREVARRLLNLGEGEAELRDLGVWEERAILQGELEFFEGNLDRAYLGFQSALEKSAAAPSYDGLRARLGIARCLMRAGRREILQTQGGAFLLPLTTLASPEWKAWGKVFDFFLKKTDAISENELIELVDRIRTLEAPERRLEMLDLLAADLERRGFAKAAQLIRSVVEQQRNLIRSQLPEELRMDYEKKPDLSSLEKKLQEWLPPQQPAPSVPPTGGVAISEARFRQFSEINRQIAEKMELKEILERVMDAAIEFTGAERGFLLWRAEGKGNSPVAGFDIKTARHLSQVSLKAEEFQLSRSALQQAIEKGSHLLIDDAQSDPRLQEKKSVVLFQLLSILVVPLEFGGQILGALYLDHRYQPGCFTTEHVLLLHAFASQAALAIQKARMIEDLKKSNERLSVEVRDQAQHIQNLTGELAQAREQLRYEYTEIIGHSPPMMRVFQLLDHVTATSIPVWIKGESGSGKELIAHCLHYNSPRKTAPFVTENVSAIPETLLESELFGHKKGAFTHADRDRIGLFEQADGGTLFLDEIADMSMAMQAKLLRVLQEGEVRPVGSTKKVKVNVRLVTASNRDLNQMVRNEKFRQDLFFRINGLTIVLPSLRERKEDIPLLVEHFVKKIAKEFGLSPSVVSDEAYQVMLDYPWPGNIRELESVMRNALLFAKGRPITPEFLTLNLALVKSPELSVDGGSLTKQRISDSGEKEKEKVVELLRRHRLDKEKVADELGISLRSLYTRLERLGLPKKKSHLAKLLQM